MNKHRFFKTYSSFSEFLKNINYELILISPYMKIDAFKKLIHDVPTNIKIIAVCRWRISDIVLGVSDLDIYSYLKNRGNDLYINNDIHLKVLMKDKKEIIIGSVNITRAGLGFAEKSNIEAISIDDVNDNDIINIMKILKNSILIDDSLFKRISNEVLKFKGMKNYIRDNVKKMNALNKKLNTNRPKNIIVADFPFSITPRKLIDDYSKNIFDSIEMKHDLKLFNLTRNENSNELYKKLKQQFLKSNAFQWQKNIIKNEILFGKYSQILHNSLMDNPKPYRKIVKELVRNMFNWTLEFSDKFLIKRYRHTSSICKK